MVYIYISGRVIANAEALNMTETIGNVSKHRRVPYIMKTSEGYRVIYVPAISGESLGHAFQSNLVEAAKLIYEKEKINPPPIDQWAMRNEMIKFSDKKHITDSLKEILQQAKSNKGSKKTVEDFQHEFERVAIKESLVADIGGFMLAEELPIRRTSLFYVGYATPIEDAVAESVIEAQMHTRQIASKEEIEEKTEEEIKEKTEKEERKRKSQMIYYVEVASTVYGISFFLDISNIGKTSMIRKEDVVDNAEKLRRVKTALLALSLTFGAQQFGAKRSRFNPILSVESLVGVVSHPVPIAPVPPQKKRYIEETIKKVEKTADLMKNLELEFWKDVIVYGEKVEGVKSTETPEEFFKELTRIVLSRLGAEGP
ncbi:MAG: type I-A CRISPR-associated protein Cas7/Csa2 [Fervidicoccaceae archaeon]